MWFKMNARAISSRLLLLSNIDGSWFLSCTGSGKEWGDANTLFTEKIFLFIYFLTMGVECLNPVSFSFIYIHFCYYYWFICRRREGVACDSWGGGITGGIKEHLCYLLSMWLCNKINWIKLDLVFLLPMYLWHKLSIEICALLSPIKTAKSYYLR